MRKGLIAREYPTMQLVAPLAGITTALGRDLPLLATLGLDRRHTMHHRNGIGVRIEPMLRRHTIPPHINHRYDFFPCTCSSLCNKHEFTS